AGGEQRTVARKEKEQLAFTKTLFHATERTFGHLKFWSKVQGQLDRADLPLRTVEFLYVMAGSAFVTGLLFAMAGPPTWVILAAFAGGGLLPYAFLVWRAKKRLKAFDAQLPDLLTTIAASLKAGDSFRQGIQAVVDEGQEPESKEFKRGVAE